MKLVIDGREYPAVNPATANLLHLMELRQQSREFTEDGKGLGMRALNEMKARGADYQRQRDAAKAAGESEDDVPPPEDMDLWMAVCLFLSRRAGGDRLTFPEAADVRMADIGVVPEAGDELAADAPDPTQPGSAGPETPEAVTETVPAAVTPGLSTT